MTVDKVPVPTVTLAPADLPGSSRPGFIVGTTVALVETNVQFVVLLHDEPVDVTVLTFE